jgi:putative transposase
LEVDRLLGEYEGPEQLSGPDGLINRLRRRVIERAAGAELEQHLGYPPGGEPGEGQANRRNGVRQKTLRTVDGPVTVELPRDRDASFEPRIVPKRARSFDGFDEQILALYAGGMTTREIQRHLAELYGVDVSDGLISEVTASIRDDVRAWQSRPLEELYVVVYLDALQGGDPLPAGRQREGRLRRDRRHARGRTRLPRPLDREGLTVPALRLELEHLALLPHH